MQVSAKGSNGVSLEVAYDFGANLDEMVDILGDNIVY